MASGPNERDYEDAGLLDDLPGPRQERLELLDWLHASGFSVEEMREANTTGALAAMVGDRTLVPGDRATRLEAIERSGLSPELFDGLVGALGFLPVRGAPAGEPGFTTDEIATLHAFGSASEMFSLDEALAFARVVGSSLARIGESAVSLFLADVESPHVLAGESELGLGRKVAEANRILDGFAALLDPLLRRQTLQAIDRSRRATLGETDRYRYRYAVGFVDLVGWTTMSGELPARELADFVRRFEQSAHDVASAHGARVVKLIGDEVMFVAVDPTEACRTGLALIDRFADGEQVLPRGGAAFGDVVPRGGDYYGTVVNLAARLVDLAVPGELLITDELGEACRAPSEPAGRRMVKGFTEPVTVRAMTAASAGR